MKRPKHKAPVLFGQRMRLANHYEGRFIWVRVYGDMTAQLSFNPDTGATAYAYSFGKRDGFARTAARAVLLLESLIRRTGRALPAAALVSRTEQTELVRMGHLAVTRYFSGR